MKSVMIQINGLKYLEINVFNIEIINIEIFKNEEK